MKNLFTKLALLAVLLCTASLSHAECYNPSNATGAGVPVDCVSVDAYINAAGQAVPFSIGDICQNTNIAKSSVPVNITTATTTAVIAAIALKKIYVCSVNAYITGTTPTVLFLTGTQTTTACDTGAINLTGTFPFTTGTLIAWENANIEFTSLVGGQMCITTGGTSPSVQGFITYVQQ